MSEHETEDPGIDAFAAAMQRLPEGVAEDGPIPYVLAKAERFLRLGPEQYRQEDFFREPRTTDPAELELLREGCRKLLAGEGWSVGNPLTGLGVAGGQKLLALFHFVLESRRTAHGVVHAGRRGALDSITFRHRVHDESLVCWNFCEPPGWDDENL